MKHGGPQFLRADRAIFDVSGMLAGFAIDSAATNAPPQIAEKQGGQC